MSAPLLHRREVHTPTKLTNDTASDTDGTPQHKSVGGLGRWSHGKHNLVHQHWVLEVISAGSFDVHDVEAAEAFHKHCMLLPSCRVRHWTNENKTHHDMLRFLLRDLLFRALKTKITPCVLKNRRKLVGMTKKLSVTMGEDLAAVHVQTSILHREVRIARVELMDMLCLKLNIPACRSTYKLLGGLQWEFGQKYTDSDGQIYWCTDSQYGYSSSGLRRDILVLHGSSETKIRLADGQVVSRQTALCCQTICFVRLTYIRSVLQRFPVPTDIKKQIEDDCLTLVLVRWLQAHPTATERDCNNFPMCPVPFHVNHALWQFAVTPTVRKVLIDPVSQRPTKVFDAQRKLFGQNVTEQHQCLERESRAYYGLVKTSSIKKIVFMSREFDHEKCTQSDTWLQTLSF